MRVVSRGDVQRTFLTDSHRFMWKRTASLLGHSTVTVEWDIPTSVISGVYRIKHFGHEKSILGSIHPYTGTSGTFIVEAGNHGNNEETGMQAETGKLINVLITQVMNLLQ